jgi:hypothetical protein
VVPREKPVDQLEEESVAVKSGDTRESGRLDGKLAVNVSVDADKYN